MDERVPPHDLDAEMALIGSLLAHADSFDDVLPIIGGPDVFYLPAHRTLFAAIACMRDDNRPVDLLTMTDELRGTDRLESVGGQDYMITLAESFADWANAEHYADIVLKHHKRRELIGLAGKLEDDAYAPLCEPDGAAAEYAQAIEGVATRSSGKQVEDATVLIDRTLEALQSDHSPVGYVRTGCMRFDDEIGGLPRGCMTILAARTSVGKTSLSLQWALQARHDSVPVLFVSAEMGRMQIAMRLVTMTSGEPLRNLEEPRTPESRTAAFKSARSVLATEGLYVTDCTKDVRRIVALSRARVRMFGVGLIVVDYLQLCTMRGRYSTTNELVSDMSRTLKGLASDTGAAVVVLSQFSRDVAKQDREPQLSDLRDSGAIEQDADLVLLMSARPSRGRDDEQPERELLVNAAKNRNGPTGRFMLTFHKASMTFRSEAVAPTQ